VCSYGEEVVDILEVRSGYRGLAEYESSPPLGSMAECAPAQPPDYRHRQEDIKPFADPSPPPNMEILPNNGKVNPPLLNSAHLTAGQSLLSSSPPGITHFI
jgi:hypothetical protein